MRAAQGLLQIVDQILHILDAGGQAQQVRGHRGAGAFDAGAVLDQALGPAERGRPLPDRHPRGGEAAAIATAAAVRLWKRATSLGGTESLIEHRASVEGAGTPAPPDLLRLSVGLEHVDDLIADLEQALAAATR